MSDLSQKCESCGFGPGDHTGSVRTFRALSNWQRTNGEPVTPGDICHLCDRCSSVAPELLDTAPYMVQLHDVLPSGQTGFDLTLDQRCAVRRYYRWCLGRYSRKGARRYATLVARDISEGN
jgi:hypothetical protein